jgi:hypothetical protein
MAATAHQNSPAQRTKPIALGWRQGLEAQDERTCLALE